MGKHKRKKVRGHEYRACDVCGEHVKTFKVRLVVNGKPEASWRCCAACTAVKRNALTGKGPTGMRLLRPSSTRVLRTGGNVSAQ